VLIAAYAAFAAGAVSYFIFMRRYSRRIYCRLAQGGSRNYSFNETGIHSTRDAVEMQVAWRAIKSIEDHGWAVFFQSGEFTIFIPSRLFASAAERAGFVVAMRAYAKAAAIATQ